MTIEELMKELNTLKMKMKDTKIVMKTLNANGSFVAVDVNSIEVTRTLGKEPMTVVVLSPLKKQDKSSMASRLLNKMIKPFK